MDSKLKGDFAEAIVKYMFRASGVKVFTLEKEEDRERLFSYLEQIGRFNVSELREKLIRRSGVPIPDLAIVIQEKELEYVEVKYRNSCNYLLNQEKIQEEFSAIRKEYDCSIMLVTDEKFVSPEHIAVILRGNEIKHINVLEMKHWRIKQKVLQECEELVRKIYSSNNEPSL